MVFARLRSYVREWAVCVSACRALQFASDCTRQWEAFGPERYLNASQVVARPEAPFSFKGFKASWHNNADGFSQEGLFVDPKSNFAFCLIEKNACSAWTAIMHKIMKDDPNWNDADYGVAKRNFDKVGPTKYEQVFKSATAVRAVMVREPLARFASAFLDKCFKSGCRDDLCRMRSRAGHPIAFKTAVEWYLQQDPTTIEPHWQLQSFHCQLFKRVQEFTLIGLMTKDTLSADASCILNHAGLARFNTLGETRNTSFFHSSHPNSQISSDDLEDTVLKQLFTKDAARKMIAHMHLDYALFNFPPEPAWVAEATGEWYDTVPNNCSNAPITSSKSSFSALSLQDEDDNVALARMVYG